MIDDAELNEIKMRKLEEMMKRNNKKEGERLTQNFDSTCF